MPTPFIDLEEQRDLRACRAMLSNGSRTFLAASRFLPEEVAAGASALYAFCRDADDLVDAREATNSAVEGMRDRLQLIYLGRPIDAPADRSFARAVQRYEIPQALPSALLDGFAWDAEGKQYSSLAELHEYAARVAGTVGAMMALIMGVTDQDALARACDLGVAMQLSNIARDVGEDARMGRLYLPLDWMREAGITPSSWLEDPIFDARLGTVVKRILEEAERLYRRAAPGISALPLACRSSIEVARLLYREIGEEVARHGFDSVSRRARVSPMRKIATAAPAVVTVLSRRRGMGAEPLDATWFLIEAVKNRSERRVQHADQPSEAMHWLINLFSRLERRERSAPAL